jgi:hypothetical protein
VLAAKNFGAPVSLVLQELDSKGMLDTAVENPVKYSFPQNLAGVVLSVLKHSKLRKTESVICCVI